MLGAVKILMAGLLFWPLGQNLLDSYAIPEPSEMPCAAHNESFLGTEYLRYEVYYNLNFVWIPAGDVEFTIQETDSSYVFNAIGKTYPSYEWFYRVEDSFRAVVDKSSLMPREAYRSVEEGDFTKSEQVYFNQEQGLAESELTRQGVDMGHETVDTEGCIQDVLSALYFLRNQPIEQLESGDLFSMRVYLDQEIFDTDVAFAGRRKKKIRGIGKCETYLLEPELINGEVFKEGDEMKVYVSTDKNRLPLLVESPVVVGSVKAVLKEYRNLRHPLEL